MSAAGEIWANMLHNVYAALVEEHNFSSTAQTDPDGREGNVVFLRLFMDGLSKQPCFPTCKCSAHHVNAVESYTDLATPSSCRCPRRHHPVGRY